MKTTNYLALEDSIMFRLTVCLSGLAVLVMFVGVAEVLAGPTPILEYRFNETGNTAASTGTDTTSVGFFSAPDPGTPADLHTPAGGGVSGLPWDRAFDNTAANGHGYPHSAGLARHSADNESIDALTSFTLAGWLKPDSTIWNNGTIISTQDPGTGFSLSSGSDNQLELEVPGSGLAVIYSDPAYTGTDWFFFAVSYDGTLSSDNVMFYKGTLDESVIPVGTALTMNQGPANNDSQRLLIGNIDDHVDNWDFQLPMDALIDDIRIFGEVVGQTDLEAFRVAAIVPEPSSLVMLAIGALGLMVYRLRRRR